MVDYLSKVWTIYRKSLLFYNKSETDDKDQTSWLFTTMKVVPLYLKPSLMEL